MLKHRGSLQDLLFVHMLILSIMNIIPQKEKKYLKDNIFVLFFKQLCGQCWLFIKVAFLLVKLLSDEDSEHFITMAFQESQYYRGVLSIICCVGFHCHEGQNPKPKLVWTGVAESSFGGDVMLI